MAWYKRIQEEAQRRQRGMDAAQEKVRGAAQEGTVQEIEDVVDTIIGDKAHSRTQSRT